MSRGTALLLLILSLPAAAQEVDVDVSALRPMFGILQAMRAGVPRATVEARLDALLDTRPYRVMFAHYNRSWRPNHLPKDVFRRMILGLRFSDVYKPGEHERADAMRVHWKKVYEEPSRYEKKLVQLETVDLPKLIDEGVEYAQSWLPPEWKIPDFYFPILPHGGSPAFTIEDAQGYDFLQLPEDASGRIDLQWLAGTIAHESHHLGVQTSAPESLTPAETMAFRVVNLAVAEGMATKFVSGAPTGCVPPIEGARFHTMSPAFAKEWDAHVANAAEIVKHQAALLDRALAGELTGDAFNADLRNYWLSGTVGRAYVLGAEMFGAIYVAFGKEGIFSALKDPRRLFAMYNAALDAKPDVLGRCVRVPEKTVQQALAIGKAAS